MSHPAKQMLKDYFTASQQYFESYLEEQVKEAGAVGGVNKPLVEYFRDVARDGKRIRGALMVLGYELCGGKDKTEILKASIAVECLHAGFLVQDDIMDDDILRRGHEALHVHFAKDIASKNIRADAPLYGISMGICAGDISYFYAFDILTRSGFAHTDIVRACNLMARYATRVGYGQALDVANITHQDPTVDEVFAVMRYKTAEYTGVMPLLMGAYLAGEQDTDRLQALTDYGLAFGWAFQIQDDILGTYGDMKTTGKPNDSDIRKGKNTLLIQTYRDLAPTSEKEFLISVLGNSYATTDDVHVLAERIQSSGALAQVTQMGYDYVERGVKLIPQITNQDDFARTLESLIRYMMERVE